jgi:phosphopantothenoylcysteine decarboxylase/phosphopantothenate--cysteine ligase
MAEPEDIVSFLDDFFIKETKQPLKGTKALVTAGPTYERLDPVRFIGNFSSGKMGIALAEALADKGAQVTLVLGPSHFETFHRRVQTIKVESAEEMYQACTAVFSETEIAILSAAVADYKPVAVATEKIKKQENALELSLVKTTDILASLGKKKRKDQILVGFALETTNEKANASKKLKEKNADLIVLNSLRDEGAGFAHDTNKVTLVDASGALTSLPLQSKTDVASAIVNYIVESRHVEKAI